MAEVPKQLVLDLPHRSALGLEDFLVSGSNEAAVRLIDAETWPNGAALVVGPEGAGKSHLASVWQAKTGAQLIRALEAEETRLEPTLSNGAVVIEDLDRGIADAATMFHALNVARQGRLKVLLTSRCPAGELDISLPDLRSRVRALNVANIERPDEALLRAVVVKLFEDRQLEVAPDVINYMMLRMERSMAAANAIVADIDRLGLAMRRKVTKQLVQTVLAGHPPE